MQPHYFPWAGYFRLMSLVDVFVYLDDVIFERATWQNRNRILFRGSPSWLTVPIDHISGAKPLIMDARITETKPWRELHRDMVSEAYGNAAYGGQALELVAPTLDRSLTDLASLNEAIITTTAGKLGITPEIVRSSELGIPGKRTARLIEICEHFGAGEYISPPGSAEYLTSDGFTEKTKVKLSYNDFDPPAYSQNGSSQFVSHLSILDVVANLGLEKTADYVRGSR